MRSFSRHIRSLFFLLTLFALLIGACTMPNVGNVASPVETRGPAATPTAFEEEKNLPPDVVEALPLTGSRIGLEEALTFYFNQPMDRASVEAAWQIEPAVAGDFSWQDDATITFTPREKLTAGSKLKVAFGTGAKSTQGVALPESREYVFNAADSLHPIDLLPEDGSVDLSVDSAIAVTFDQPVVALGADPASLPAAFRLEPAAQGRGEWLNTSAYIFYPEPALAGGLTYRAILDESLTSVAGTSLAEGKSWAFTTAVPTLLEIEPSTETPLPLDLAMTLRFNQPMDRASVESNFALLGPVGAATGVFEWADDQRSVTFTVDQLLVRNSSYRLVLGADTKALGGTPLDQPWDIEMISAPELSVVSTSPEQGGVTNEWGSSSIYFSTQLDTKDANDYVSISPEVQDFSANAYEDSLYLDGTFDPETSYTVTVSGNLKDRWGGSLGEDYLFRFTTPAPEPHISLPYIGAPFYYATATAPRFYIQSTNISNVNITLGEVPLADFFRLFGDNSYDERTNYQPANDVSWMQNLGAERNKSETFALDLAPEADRLASGIYSLLVQAGNAEEKNETQYLVVSNVNVVFKYSATDALVWATNTATNAPLIAKNINIYAQDGTLVASGTTDEKGFWHGELPAQEDTYPTLYAVLGEPGAEDFGLGASVWGEDLAPWRFDLDADFRPPRTFSYLYTDRPIYRPGDTVYFRAMLRKAYDGAYSPTDLTSLPLTVSNSAGDNIHSLNPSLSAYGTAHGSFTLPADSQPGYYSFYNRDLEVYADFLVAEYRKPEIDLSVAMSPNPALAGSPLSAEIKTRYYFDAPASNINVQWYLYDESDYFPLNGYHVGKSNIDWLDDGNFAGYYGEQIASGTGKTNAEGILNINFDDLEFGEGTRDLTLEVTVQDESNQQISERASITLHPEEFYIGLRPDLWIGNAGTEMGFDLLTVDWNQNPRATQNLRAEFKQVTWERQDSVNAFGSPTYVPTYTPISDVDLFTAEDGAARLSFTPPNAGTYMLEVSGGNASTQILLWVRGSDKGVFPNLPYQHVELTPDRESYAPGDTAEIFIPNPFGVPVQALITVERSTIHKSEIITLEENGTTYSLPLTEEDAPNIFFSAALLGQGDYRVGYTELIINSNANILNVNLTSQPSRGEPGGEVTFGIQVSDASGAPVQGEFSLAVVDLAALDLAEPNSEPIDEAFYDKVGIGVRTTLSLAGDSIYGVYLDGAGGMGGGGGEEIPSIRDQFKDTAYWNAEIVTDAKGQAQVSMTLPDNLTTWQIDLRGITQNTLVGSAAMQLVSSKDLLLRPVTPRFLVVGDHVEMAAIIHNNTAEEQSGRVSLQAIGFLLDDANSIEQQVTIPAGGRTKVSWWGTAQDAEVAELLFNANFGDKQDITRPEWGALPILRYTAPQSFVTGGSLNSAGMLTESISLPRSFVPSGGKLDVTLDASLASAILKSLEAIPAPSSNASNEALLSYLLPNVAAYNALKAANLSDPDLEARLEASLEDGVQRLLNNQAENYGWNWYAAPTHNPSGSGGVNASPSLGGGGIEGDPYLSAYILFGLWQAREAEVYIDETVFINARDYLHSASLPYLSEANPAGWQKDRLAFMQYVMQMTGGADAIAVDKLVEWRDGLSPWAQALLALTLDSRSAGDARASSLLANLETSARRSADGAHWESDASSWQNPGTPVYTTATVAYALAQQRGAGDPLVEDAIRYVNAHRNVHGYWASTYENAWSLLALTEAAKSDAAFNASYTFSADLNGSILAEGQANPLAPVTATTLLDGLQLVLPNALHINRGEGTGKLYYRAALSVDRAAETAPALNQGIEVSRAYYDAACEADCVPLDTATIMPGAQIKAQVTLTLADNSYYVMVEDYIPAGTEILNQNLLTAQQGIEADEAKVYDPDRPFADGWGWWLFAPPQIGDENIRWSADYLPAGTYVLSYTLTPLQAGEYRVLPAHAWQSFFPDMQGASAGEVFAVKE